MFRSLGNLFKRVCREVFTSSADEFDPARVFGYGFVLVGGTVFIVLSIYDTMKNGKFDYINYSAGIAAISAALVSAAAGVVIKRTSEKDPNPPPPPPAPNPDAVIPTPAPGS